MNVKGMVRNRHLAKSISDVAWSTFRSWLEYFGTKYGKATVAVPPHHTSQNCSNCGEVVKKSLSVRTHVCPHCNHIEDRDVNAAKNILQKALCTVGHTGTHAWGDLPSGLVGEILLSDDESMFAQRCASKPRIPIALVRGVSIDRNSIYINCGLSSS